ncbi:MAG: AraC family transcriptional regulator [Bacteroidales bacterium]
MKKKAEGFSGEKAIITPYSIRSQQLSNPISKQLYVTHIGYYPHARFHYRERKEGAKENVFIYCAEGEGWLQTDGNKVDISKNQCIILPANKYHAYGAKKHKPWSIYWFHFLGENVPLFSSIIGKVININESDTSRINDRLSLFEEMYENLEMGYSPENLEYVSLCLTYFLSSIKYINQYRKVNNIKKTDIIQSSIIFMKENLENKITLEDIASNVGYSASHFGTLFTQRTSFSPMVYYNQLKIQRACSYLQFTDLKIKEISYRLGFYDQFHFSKAFTHEMSLSPKVYRTRYKNEYTPQC